MKPFYDCIQEGLKMQKTSIFVPYGLGQNNMNACEKYHSHKTSHIFLPFSGGECHLASEKVHPSVNSGAKYMSVLKLRCG